VRPEHGNVPARMKVRQPVSREASAQGTSTDSAGILSPAPGESSPRSSEILLPGHVGGFRTAPTYAVARGLRVPQRYFATPRIRATPLCRLRAASRACRKPSASGLYQIVTVRSAVKSAASPAKQMDYASMLDTKPSIRSLMLFSAAPPPPCTPTWHQAATVEATLCLHNYRVAARIERMADTIARQ